MGNTMPDMISPSSASQGSAPGGILEVMVDFILKKYEAEMPGFIHAVQVSCVPRWLDPRVVNGLCAEETCAGFTPETFLNRLRELPFCKPHPTLPGRLLYEDFFRKGRLEQLEQNEELRPLEARAERVFTRLLEDITLPEEKRYDNAEWTELVTEQIYHAARFDLHQGLERARRVCAEAMAGWQTDFCIQLVSSLEAGGIPVDFLKAGFTAAMQEKFILTLPLLEDLAALPDLPPKVKSRLLYWMGTIHLNYEGRTALALKRLQEARDLDPTSAVILATISGAYTRGGLLGGRFDLAEAAAKEAIEKDSSLPDGYSALERVHLLTGHRSEAASQLALAASAAPAEVRYSLEIAEMKGLNGDLNGALAEFDRLLEKMPERASQILQSKGSFCCDNRRFPQALEALTKLVEMSGDQPDAQIDLGALHAQMGNSSEALACFRKAIELDPDSPTGYERLAEFLVSLEKHQKAIDCVQSAFQRGARSQALFDCLYQIYLQQRRHEDIRKLLKENLEWNPEDAYLIHCASVASTMDHAVEHIGKKVLPGLIDDMRATLRQALEIDDRRAWAYCLQAGLEALLGDPAAIPALRKQVESCAPWACYDFLVHLGRAYRQGSKENDAEEILIEATRLAPNRLDAWIELDALYDWTGDIEKQLIALEEEKRIAPSQAYLIDLHIGQVLLHRGGLGDLDDARAVFERARALEPDTGDAYLHLARVDEQENRPEVALQHYILAEEKSTEVAIQSNTRMAAILRTLALYSDAERAARYSDAEQAARAAIELDPERPDGYIQLALAGRDSGKKALTQTARRSLAKADRSRQYDLELAIGWDDFIKEKYEPALQAALKCIRWQPDRAEPRVLQAYILIQTGEFSQAKTLLDEVLTMQGRADQLATCIRAGDYFEEHEQLELADEFYGRADQLRKNPPEGLALLAALRRRQGKKEEAIGLYRQVLERAGIPHIQLGRYYQSRERFEDALEVYRDGLTGANDLESARLEHAIGDLFIQKAQANGELEMKDAVEYVQGLPERAERIEKPEDQALVHSLWGQLYERLHLFDRAIEHYTRVIELAPGQEEGYEVLIQLHLKLEQGMQAVKVARKMALRPELAYQAHIRAGLLLKNLGESEKAEHEYRKAAHLDPEQVWAFLYLARLLVDDGRLEEAEKPIRRAIRLAPQNGFGYLLRAELEAERADLEGQHAHLEDQRKEWEKAQKDYRRAGELEADQASTCFERAGNLLMALDRWDEAETFLIRATKRDSNNRSAYLSLGYLYYQKNMLDKAQAIYERVAEIDYRAYLSAISDWLEWSADLPEGKERQERAFNAARDYADTLIALANINSSRGDRQKLNQTDRKLCQLFLPEEVKYQVLTSLSQAFQAIGNNKRAETRLKQAVRFLPDNPDAYIQWINLLLADQKFPEAHQAQERMAARKALDYDARVIGGELWMIEEKMEQAREFFQQAIKIAPDRPTAYLRLGEMNYSAGDTEGAVQILLDGLKATQRHPDLLLALGDLRQNTQKIDEAIALYREYIAGSAESAWVGHERIGTLLVSQNQPEDALSELEESVKQRPPSEPAANAWSSIGAARELLNNLDGALEAFQISADQDPSNRYPYLDQIRVLGEQGNVSALSALIQKVKGFPADEEYAYQTLLYASAAYQQVKLFHWAMDEIKQALSCRPERSEAYIQAGYLYEVTRDWNKAAEMYLAGNKISPEAPGMLETRMGILAMRQGKMEEAEQQFLKAVQAAPEFYDPISELGQIYIDTGRNEQALELFEKAAHLADPDSSTSAYLFIADIYHKEGRKDLADEQCRKALAVVEGVPKPKFLLLRRAGLADFKLGKYAEAADIYQRALEKEPKEVVTHLYLALDLLMLGKRDESRQHQEAGLQLAELEDYLDYPIREAEVQLAEHPEVEGLKDLLEAMRKKREELKG